MVTKVSRFTGAYNEQGQRMCIRCLRRPARRSPKRWQSYCQECHAQYVWERRRGLVQVLLTADEWAAVKAARDAQLAGRHHRG